MEPIDCFDAGIPTFLENWPEDLRDLSIPQTDLPLTVEEMRALGSSIVGHSQEFDPNEQYKHEMKVLVHRVHEAVSQYPMGAFLRLGSRSPKDSWLGIREGFRVISLDADPLRFFRYESERAATDLLAAIDKNYLMHLWVRQWVDIDPSLEFRCFMENRKLVGVSQYNYREHYAALPTAQKEILKAVNGYFPMFESACHLDSVVFDVFLTPSPKRRGRYSVTLIEINPWQDNPDDMMTNPCLYSWGVWDRPIKVTPFNGEASGDNARVAAGLEPLSDDDSPPDEKGDPWDE